MASPETETDEPAVALAPGRKIAASQSSHHVFRFGMTAFLVASVLFSLQFLAWNLLGLFVGSVVNVTVILAGTVAVIAVGVVSGAKKPGGDRFWDQALIRGMLAFYLMAAIAILAGGGQMIWQFVEVQRQRYVVQERFGFSAEERFAIDGDETVEIITTIDVDPSGRFARAGIAPGVSIVVGDSADEFYARLHRADVPSTKVTLVTVPGGVSLAPDITKLPKRTTELTLQDE